MRFLSPFKRCENGATAVEFAVVLPVLLTLMFGLIEFSLIMFTKSVMEGATTVTSRLGKTGYTAEGQSRQDMLVALLTEQSYGLLDPEKIEITTLVYQSFDDIGAAEPLDDLNGNAFWDEGENYVDINGNGAWDNNMGEAGLGNAGDIVVYKVEYPWPVATPIISKIIGNSEGNMPLEVSVVVRNEPYDSGS